MKNYEESLSQQWEEFNRDRELICPICGLDGFENEDDLDIHLEECDE